MLERYGAGSSAQLQLSAGRSHEHVRFRCGEDQFYGERGGLLRDPFGQQWMMSQHIEDVPAEEMARRAAVFFSGR